MPFVETRYRVDRSRRTFVGYSLSGSYGGTAMFYEDPLDRRFSAVIAIDGSFWRQTHDIHAAEQAYFDTTRSLPVSFFLASATNVQSISAFRQRLEARGYQGLRMLEVFYGLSHAAVLSPGLVEGLLFVFQGN